MSNLSQELTCIQSFFFPGDGYFHHFMFQRMVVSFSGKNSSFLSQTSGGGLYLPNVIDVFSVIVTSGMG